MLDSVELDDAPPFTRVERRLAAWMKMHLGERRGNRQLLVEDEYIDRVFAIMARSALTTYADLRLRRVGEVMYHPIDHPDWDKHGIDLLPEVDPDARVRRYGDNGTTMDGHPVPTLAGNLGPDVGDGVARNARVNPEPITPAGTRAYLNIDWSVQPERNPVIRSTS